MPLRNLLITADIAGLTAAFVISESIFKAVGIDRIGSGPEALSFVLSLPVWVLVARAHGLYDNARDRTGHGTVDDISGVFHLVAVGGWLLFFAAYASGLVKPNPEKLSAFLLLAVVFVTLARTTARAISRRHTARVQRVIVLGAGRVGQLVAKKFRAHPEYGVDVIGFVDTDPMPMRTEVVDLDVLGSMSDLPQIVATQRVDRVVVAFSKYRPEELATLARRLQDRNIFVDIVPQMFESIGPSAFVHQVEGLPLVGVPPLRSCRLTELTKRSMDVALSAVAICALAPVLALIAIRIRLDSPGKILYCHDRIGRGGRAFRLYKFRTMDSKHCRGADYGGEDAEAAFAALMADPERRAEFTTTFKLQDDPRVTKFGRKLRRTSLDELPQLYNVLRGDLSLVGPRPVTQEELDRYGGEVDELLTVRPGVTGYWQINGRSEIDYDERVRLDKVYLASRSLRLDSVILAKTVRVILARSGAF